MNRIVSLKIETEIAIFQVINMIMIN